jgi:hypothetical protein
LRLPESIDGSPADEWFIEHFYVKIHPAHLCVDKSKNFIAMKLISLAMPLALLTLSFIACNGRSGKDEKANVGELDSKIRDLKSVQSKSPEGDQLLRGNSEAADSAVGLNDHEAAEQNADKKNRAPRQRPSAAPQANPDWDKKIVKTADLNVEVKNFAAFDALMIPAVRRFGAYVAQEQQTQTESRIGNSMTIKVPVEQFDDAVNWLSHISDSNKMMEKKISSEDVTMEVVDTRSRMESKREVMEKYHELLRQAHTMDDILRMQHEINDVQGEIESAQGRVNYLGHASAFSTINLQYYQVLDATATPKETEPSFVHKIRLAFAEGWNWVSSLLLAFVSLWPLAIAGLFAWMMIRRWRSLHPKPVVAAQHGAAGGRQETN